MSDTSHLSAKWAAANISSQTGRLFLVTGGNSGIGYCTAVELARSGAEVILPARTEAKTRDAAARLKQEVPSAKLHLDILDLSDMSSVRAFVARLKQKYSSGAIDVLINNAGVMSLPTREVTADGFERQFATNYLGPFLLTGLLMPMLRPRAGSRVVTVASTMANSGKIQLDDLQSERDYKPQFGAYSQSKLADLIFAVELQRRLQAAASPIASLAAHPGWSHTNLNEHLSFGLKVMAFLSKPFYQSAEAGALPILFAATSPEAKPGAYYGPNGFKETKGHPGLAAIPSAAKDSIMATRLWAASEELLHMPFTIGQVYR